MEIAIKEEQVENTTFEYLDDLNEAVKVNEEHPCDNLADVGQAINQFLNTNSEEIITEMKPAASVSIARHFKAFLNSAFLKVPLQVWLPGA